MASSNKGRFRACGASVGALIGAAAALVPASCTSGPGAEQGTTMGTGGTTGTGGMPITGTGGMTTTGTGGKTTSTGGSTTGTGGMSTDGGPIGDAHDELDGTLVDLDGASDAPHVPSDGGDADVS